MANPPTFSLAYTSVRPQTIPEVIALWNKRSACKDHEWIVSVDEGDLASKTAAETACAEAMRDQLCGSAKVVINTGSKDCNAGWNCAAESTTGKVIICVADDFLPPQSWDDLLLSLSPKGWEDGEYVVKVEDGYVHDIFVLSILTRKRYERFGYVFYPAYRSMFNDTEFGDVAVRDNVVINANHLLFEHLHPDCGKRTRDGVDLVHASKDRWAASEMLYKFRKSRNFPQDMGPKAIKEPEVKVENAGESNFVAYLQVTKDDFCLLEVCLRLAQEGVRDFFFCQPDAYWTGEPVDPESRAEVSCIVQLLRDKGHTVHLKMFHVEQYRSAGSSMIQVETALRNASLDCIRSAGYKHILVVDGDELWIPGLLNIVKGYVNQGHLSVAARMIPVIGFPGYPVDGASDVAIVYIGQTVSFFTCRTPTVVPAIIPRPMIYHFTGTRKTLDETVAKHRRGGHYDDPDYDFEGWIKNTLPNIRPGLKNAHMYKPRQIWPSVRAWRPLELSVMPEAVKPYLGSETQL